MCRLRKALDVRTQNEEEQGLDISRWVHTREPSAAGDLVMVKIHGQGTKNEQIVHTVEVCRSFLYLVLRHCSIDFQHISTFIYSCCRVEVSSFELVKVQ